MAISSVALQSGQSIPWIYLAILLLILLVGGEVYWRSGGQKTKKCQNCDEEWEVGVRRCPNCGANISPGMEATDASEEIGGGGW